MLGAIFYQVVQSLGYNGHWYSSPHFLGISADLYSLPTKAALEAMGYFYG